MRSSRKLSAAITVIASCIALYLNGAAAFNEDMCAQYGEYVPIPGVDGSAFCETAQLTAQNMEKCLLLDMAGRSFTGDLGITVGNSIGALACKAAEQVPIPANKVDGKDHCCACSADRMVS